MKKIIYMFAISAFTMAFVSSCGKKAETDSKEMAEEQNEATFDDDKDELKDSDFAVEVADASMLEVQLGQLAIANGSSPDDLMVKGHKDVLDKMKKESDKGTDEEIKSWASTMIPTIEHHLSMSENTQKIVKETGTK